QARLAAIEPTSVSIALARITAESSALDCLTLIDGFENHSSALFGFLDSLLEIMQVEKRAALSPFVAAAFVEVVVDSTLEDLALSLELARSDTVEPSVQVHFDPTLLARLATIYSNA